MRYRQYSGHASELKQRITQLESEHYRVTLDRKIAEELKDDLSILSFDDKLAVLEASLKVLYEQYQQASSES